jgi:hypothetical protein
MPLNLQSVALLSRRIRANLSQGKTGASLLAPTASSGIVRKLSNVTKLAGQATQQGGILQQVWDRAKSFVGWAGGLVKGIAFSATAIWGWAIGRFEQLKAFNWNASDKALQQMIEGQNVQLAAIWGSVVGQGLGWLAGIVVGGGIAYLCPVIGGAAFAKMVMSKTTQEAFEEVVPTLVNAIGQTVGAMVNRQFINGYINYRRLLKRAPAPLLEAIFGKDGAEFIKYVWGAEGGPDMSFNTQMDEFVESINNKALQAFVENLFDEAWDSFTEAGFIVAQEIDNAYQQHKLYGIKEDGTPRSVTLEPDTQGEEKLIFTAVPQQRLYPVVQQTLNLHRLLYNRDVGEIVGQPETEWARARPQLRQLTILFRDKPRPPWKHADGRRCRTATYTIPDVKPGLTWREIKNAADSFMWGKYRATANLNNQRQMAVYGATEAEAKAKLRELLRLSTAEVLTLSVTQEEDRPIQLKKEAIKMYPSFATLLARRNSIDATGRVTIDNRILDERVHRFALWTDKEPKNMPILQ